MEQLSTIRKKYRTALENTVNGFQAEKEGLQSVLENISMDAMPYFKGDLDGAHVLLDDMTNIEYIIGDISNQINRVEQVIEFRLSGVAT